MVSIKRSDKQVMSMNISILGYVSVSQSKSLASSGARFESVSQTLSRSYIRSHSESRSGIVTRSKSQSKSGATSGGSSVSGLGYVFRRTVSNSLSKYDHIIGSWPQ